MDPSTLGSSAVLVWVFVPNTALEVIGGGLLLAALALILDATCRQD